MVSNDFWEAWPAGFGGFLEGFAGSTWKCLLGTWFFLQLHAERACDLGVHGSVVMTSSRSFGLEVFFVLDKLQPVFLLRKLEDLGKNEG